MKKIKTTESLGHILCHDMTQIIPGKSKDAAFRKGHVVREEDIPVLLSMGKEHLYVWENDEDMYHENEAAEILYELACGENIHRSPVKEGKIELYAAIDGILEIDVERVNRLNSLGEMMIATRRNSAPVKKGDKLAGTRVVPLVIEKKKMEHAQNTVGEQPLLNVRGYQEKKVGIIVTGSEVYKGRIEDKFGPVLEEKLKEYPAKLLGKVIVGDNPDHIAQEVEGFMKKGADLILCTGGMSVDPDDTTPTGIKKTGAHVITYGAPVLPGAMFLLAYAKGDVPILGLPGCVMYAKRTIFDLVIPKIMAGKKLTLEEINTLGVGGLCLDCPVCIYPNCSFGS